MQGGQCLHGEIRMHGLCAIARQHREMMDLAGGARLYHQAGQRALALADQVLVYR